MEVINDALLLFLASLGGAAALEIWERTSEFTGEIEYEEMGGEG